MPVDETGEDLVSEDTASGGGAGGCNKAREDTMDHGHTPFNSRGTNVKWYSTIGWALTHYTSENIKPTHKSNMEQIKENSNSISKEDRTLTVQQLSLK